MFSRKRITRTVSSLLIVIMFMALIPFAVSNNVSGLSMKNAVPVSVHDCVYMGDVHYKTLLFHAPYTMRYRFYLSVGEEARSDLTGRSNSMELQLFDKDGKLIECVKCPQKNEMSMVIELQGDTDYYICVDKYTGGVGWDPMFYCEYDYEVVLSTKYESDTEFKKEIGGIYTQFHADLIPVYELINNCEIKADLVVGSLPDGMELTYEWIADETSSVGSANTALNITNSAVYTCSIKSTDGKFKDDYSFKVEKIDNYTFLDGSVVNYSAYAFRPGEEQTLVFPETRFDGKGNTISCYVRDTHTFQIPGNGHGKSIAGPDFTVPEAWDSTLLRVDIRRFKSKVMNYFLRFVFEDGDGVEVECGNTYHIKRTDDWLGIIADDANAPGFEGNYRQVIYRFTPETSGIYRFNTSNVEVGYPIGAIFDSDRNLVATSLGDYLEQYMVRNYVQTFDIKAELTGGKTYYIAIPYTYAGTECDLSISKLSDSPSTPVTPSEPSTTGGTFEDFVERLYVVALGRASEPDGKAHWCKVVGNGSYSGADCARFFLTSPEFKGRNLNNEEFLKVLYKTFFDRDAAADPDGFNFWLSKIDEWGRERVIEGFIDSTEWCNICASYGVRSGAMTAKATIASKNATAFATRLYTECLGRDPEEGGLKYWSLSLTNQERTGTQAAKEFFYSEEFIGKGLNDNDYVTRLYKTFMGREPDDAGKAHWLNQLSSGSMNRDQVFDFFSTCEEFTNICNQYAIAR